MGGPATSMPRIGGRGDLRGVEIGRIAVVLRSGTHDRRGRRRLRRLARDAFVCTALSGDAGRERPPPGGGSWDEVLAVALDEAVALLAERFRSDERGWRWSARVHRVRFAHRSPACRASAPCSMQRRSTSWRGRAFVLGCSTRGWGSTPWWSSWRVVVDLADLDGCSTAPHQRTRRSATRRPRTWNDQSDPGRSSRKLGRALPPGRPSRRPPGTPCCSSGR